jgi:LysR family nitrogen assimilation transcriptional regulator
MQLRHLRYFVKIVEAGSLSRAAALIPVAQPALSQQMAELEDELGVALLHRSPRGVRPTAAGDALFAEATAILRQVERIPDIVRSHGTQAHGVVRLGMSSTLASFLAGALMESCRASLPTINLRFTTGGSAQLTERVRTHTLDLALVFEDEVVAGFARLPLFRQRLYVIRNRKGSRQTAAVGLDALADTRMILPAQPNTLRTLLDRTFGAAGITPRVIAETDLFSDMLSAVLIGVGDAIVPMGDLARVPGYATVRTIPIEPPIFLTASLLWSNEEPLTAAGETVRDLLSVFVRRQLDEQLLTGAVAVACPTHTD